MSDLDFDRAVDELNALDGAEAPSGSSPLLEAWLVRARSLGASDLLLVAGVPPMTRIDGKVRPLDGEAVLDGAEIEQAVTSALPAHALRGYREGRAVDARLHTQAGRFRVNLHRERGRAAAAVRVLPITPPRLGALNLAPEVEALSRIPSGLVLVGGATGVGKTNSPLPKPGMSCFRACIRPTRRRRWRESPMPFRPSGSPRCDRTCRWRSRRSTSRRWCPSATAAWCRRASCS